VNLFPQPNGVSNGDGTAQYTTSFNAKSNENYNMYRMDYRISAKDSLYMRYVYNTANRLSARPVPIWGERAETAPHFVVFSETHVFSGTTLNDFRVAYNRVFAAAYAATFAKLDPSTTIVPGQELARIQFAGLAGSGGQLPELGTDSNRPQDFPQNTFQETETFSTTRGSQSLKFGVDVERVQINLSQTSGQTRGTERFGGLASLLAGTPTSITLTLPGGNFFERGFRRTIFGWFVQDDYRIRSNLTLNLGLRQDIYTTPTEVNGLSGQLINLTDPKETQGQPFISPKKAFSPRLGVAWDPFGDGKTSVRMGAGIYYNPVDGRAYYNASLGGNLFLNSVQISNPPFPNPLQGGRTGTVPAPAVNTLQYHLNNPTTYNYNFEVQRQLTRTLNLRAAYVESISYHLLRLVYWDTRIPTIQPDGSKLFPSSGPLKNPNFGSISYLPSDGHSNYNGLQTSLQQTLWAGAQFQISYIWSKALSTSDQAIPGTSQTTPSSVLDPDDQRSDYARSVYDERQRIIFNGSYQLPFARALHGSVAKAILGGWSINGIYSYGSGHPITILDGFNNSLTGDTNNPDRPNLNPGFRGSLTEGVTAGCGPVDPITRQQLIPAGQPLHTVARWFDPCAFSLSPAGTFGNLGRTTVIGPGTNDVDFTLARDISLSESKKLEFRWEMFNMLNHAQFYAPNQAIFNSGRNYNGSAGQITSTIGANRQMQLGLKLIF